jgi:hypothetical protein
MTMTNAYVLVNSNNDNGSATNCFIPARRDFEATGSLGTTNDAQLVKLDLLVTPKHGPGDVRLAVNETGRDRIRIWKGNKKGETNLLYQAGMNNTLTWHMAPNTNAVPDLYVEGILEGDSFGKVKLVCEYLLNNQVRSAYQLNLTVTPVLTNLKVTTLGGPPRLDDQCKKFYSNPPGAFDTDLSPTVRIDAAVKVGEGSNTGKLEILQLVCNDGSVDAGAALKDSFAQKYAFMYPYQGMYLVDATNTFNGIQNPFYENISGTNAWTFCSSDKPYVRLPDDIVDPRSPASIAISESFTDYAVWLQDGTAYFLGSTTWQVNFMADITATVDLLGKPNYRCDYYDFNGVFSAAAFALGNSNQNMDRPYANEHAKGYGAWQKLPVPWYKQLWDKIVWGF